MNFYLVGGCVRDEFLGLKPKDIDIAVEATSWEEFREEILLRTKQVYCEEPQYFRIKALNSTYGPVDYVMCRKDGLYTDGRRPDQVEICGIEEDLSRRDFTVNAIAKNLQTGEILDPFSGRKDLKEMALRCVGEPSERMSEDALRWFRAMRFVVLKGFHIDDDTLLQQMELMLYDHAKSFKAVSTDRIRQELRKCFFHSTSSSIRFILDHFSDRELFRFLNLLETRGIWLNPTTQKRPGNGE